MYINLGDVNMEILEGDELLDGTVNISTTEEGGVTVTVQSTQGISITCILSKNLNAAI